MGTETLWAALLFAAFMLMNGIALLPAIGEWRARRDALPLRVVREYDGTIRFFAQRFAAFVARNFADKLAACRRTGRAQDGALPDGQAFCIAPADGRPLILDEERRRGRVNRILLAHGALFLQDNLMFD